MGLFKRSKGTDQKRKPTRRERQAAERTAKAEADLLETEQKIHEIVDDVHGDFHGRA